MFAPVDSRIRYRRRRKLSAEAGIQDSMNNSIHLSGPFSPKVNRSLVTRRVQNLGAILHLSLLRRDKERAQKAFSILLRCEKHGVNMRTLWELGLEILLRSSGASKLKAEEFLARVRLTSSDIGHHPTTEKQVTIFIAFSYPRWFHFSHLF
jgi:RNA polymerase I specific initiation factor